LDFGACREKKDEGPSGGPAPPHLFSPATRRNSQMEGVFLLCIESHSFCVFIKSRLESKRESGVGIVCSQEAFAGIYAASPYSTSRLKILILVCVVFIFRIEVAELLKFGL
jgi:hypothetical protein